MENFILYILLISNVYTVAAIETELLKPNFRNGITGKGYVLFFHTIFIIIYMNFHHYLYELASYVFVLIYLINFYLGVRYYKGVVLKITPIVIAIIFIGLYILKKEGVYLSLLGHALSLTIPFLYLKIKQRVESKSA